MKLYDEKAPQSTDMLQPWFPLQNSRFLFWLYAAAQASENQNYAKITIASKLSKIEGGMLKVY